MRKSRWFTTLWALGLLTVLVSDRASAQGSGIARLTLQDGETQRQAFPADAMTVRRRHVESARCFSCVGWHTIYRVEVVFRRGPIARAEIRLDTVSSPRPRYSTGRGGYPGRPSIMIQRRDGTVENLYGTVEVDFGRTQPGVDARTFNSTASTSSVRRMSFEVPHVERAPN